LLKKNQLEPSAQYVQTVADKRAHLVAKVKKILDGFERHRKAPDSWQSNQLNYAIEFIAEGLFGLACCELDVLAAQPSTIATPGKKSASKFDSLDVERPIISMPQLRAKLHELH